MDVEKLVEEVARANDPDIWLAVDRAALTEAVAENATRISRNRARSAILATLRGVREADGGMMRRAFAAMNDTPSGTWKRLKAEKLPERELFAAKMHPRYTAMIDHLIKTVEG